MKVVSEAVEEEEVEEEVVEIEVVEEGCLTKPSGAPPAASTSFHLKNPLLSSHSAIYFPQVSSFPDLFSLVPLYYRKTFTGGLRVTISASTSLSPHPTHTINRFSFSYIPTG